MNKDSNIIIIIIIIIIMIIIILIIMIKIITINTNLLTMIRFMAYHEKEKFLK